MNPARLPYFIKGYNSSISHDKLKIPSKFDKHLEGKTSGTISLKGPSGNTWQADLGEQSDGLYILDGWEAFVRDHYLENGDCLVFRYDGNLHFTLQIFDQSACEKETAFSAECHQDLSIFDQHFGKKREREHASLLSHKVDSVPKKARSSPSHEAMNLSKMYTRQQETINGRCEVADFLNGSEYCGRALKNPIISVMPLSEVCPTDDELGRLSASEADKIVQAFTSSFPHFSQVMKRFNVSGSYTLNVPYQFATAYLPNCKVKVVLYNSKGESWTINSIPTIRVQTSHTFCGGWLSFVRDNDINVRDVCIFELIGKCELRVNILRIRQESLDYEDGDVNGLTNGASQKMNGRLDKNVKAKSRKTQSLALLGDQKVGFSIDKVKHGIAAKGSVAGSQSRTADGKSGKIKSLPEKRGSSKTGCTSLKSAPEEKIAAESFITTFPYFVRVMKKFNTGGSYTLKVPYQFSMEHLPNCRTAIILHNLKGERWTVNSVPTVKVQTLHTFCGGWMAFVRDNGIQMGDICIFELIGRCEMRVHISSAGKNIFDLEYPTDLQMN
uniref:B3 domain-containing protein Os01g0723500-like n=1 Tax=Erigeron canadensis TaxID=72917 RepID=UPI001CB8FC2E|nr:B3 domain-containing protein Os01g0723500-like [Erigeron canadensis]